MAKVSGKKNNKPARKKKGLPYLASILRRYYPKRYPKGKIGYALSLQRAREIKIELEKRPDEKSRRFTVRNMFSVERKTRIAKEPIASEPKLPSYFTEGIPYWELDPKVFWKTVEDQLPKTLFIKSKISRDDLPILQGGVDNKSEKQKENIEFYEEYFQDFVKWGNQMADLDPNTSSDSPNLVYFCLTTPVLKNDKWVSYLISCAKDGIKCDFGFDPENPTAEPDKLFVCDDNYELLSYNELRKEAKTRGIKLKNPKSKDLIKALRKDDDKKSAEKKQKAPQKAPDEEKKDVPTSKLSPEEIKLEEKRISLAEKRESRKKQEADNKQRELDIREKELDLKQVELNLMDKETFKKKWGV
jgi:hypothetical protein